MKVILLKNVKDVGRAGDVVDAADGFARNFLLARGLAKAADAGALAALQARRQADETRGQKLLRQGQILAKKFDSLALTFELPGSAAGTLYAGLKEFDILAKLREMVPELPAAARLVDYEPQKQAGEYGTAIELAPKVTAKLKLVIKALAR